MPKNVDAPKTLTGEVKNIRGKAQYDTDWAELQERIKEYMNFERRNWNNALYCLLKDALDMWKSKQED